MRIIISFIFILFILVLIAPKLFTFIGEKAQKRAEVIHKEIKKKGRVK